MGSSLLREHGTELNRLKPVNILQAAVKDLRLLGRKREGEAHPDDHYSFMNRHVKRARDPAHLIALAYFEPIRATSKESTLTIYNDTDLLRETLIWLLQERFTE